MKTPLPHWCRIVRECPAPYDGHLIRGAEDIARYLGDRLRAEEVEIFAVVLLNGRHRVLACSEVSRGTLTTALVHPREVFRLAIAIGASAIVLAHNHPSGSAEPSAEDLALTERLRRVGDVVGIRVLDHVVIGAESFRSLAEIQSW